MPAHIPANKYSQIVALLETGAGVSEAARKCGVTRPTVYRVKAELDDRNKHPARPVLTKPQVTENIRTIAESDASRSTDKLTAWKLYALMMGYLTDKEAASASVNINMLNGSVDITTMEREYEALRAPTTHALGVGDTKVSTSASDDVMGQRGANTALSGLVVEASGGVEPPSELESNTLSSSADFCEIIPEGDEGK